MPRLYATIVLPSGFTIEKESYLRLFNPNASFEKGNLVPDQIDAETAKLLQKSEMRKDIVIELSYKGFG